MDEKPLAFSPLSPRRLRRPVLGLLCLLALAGQYSPALAQANKQGRPGAGMPTPVSVAPAAQREIKVYLSALGSVSALNTVNIRSRVDGELVEVLFQEGEQVKAGQLLARIDPRPYEVQLAQAEGQLARDKALLDNARLDLKRYRELAAQDLIARQQVDTQEALARQYEGVVKADLAQADNARLQLTYCRIVAPISGRAGLRQVDRGNMVRASDAQGLVVITQTQPINVLFALPEDNLGLVLARLKEGAPLAVEVLDREQKRTLALGKLATLDNQIDPNTGTVKAKALVDNADGTLFPNQFVNVRLLVTVLPQALVTPAAAVQRGPQGAYVFVVDAEQAVAMRRVELGPASGSDVVVTQGLKPGEVVVTDGAERLREGAKVAVKGQGGPRGDGPPRGEGPDKGEGGKRP